MIHYSCDRCHRLIETEHDLRYVVRIEVEAKLGEADDATETHYDTLLEIDEIIERHEDSIDGVVDDEVYTRKRYDLCSECYREFIRNPLGRETSKPVGFSDN